MTAPPSSHPWYGRSRAVALTALIALKRAVKIKITAKRRSRGLATVVAGVTLVALTVPAAAASSASAKEPRQNVDYAALVNTFVGSDNQGFTFPGAAAPFGMTQVSPTGAAYTGYAYTDPKIRGFGASYLSGPHMAEQGQVSMLPTTGAVGPGAAFDTNQAATFDQTQYAVPYTHSGEVGQAGYYKTTLTPAGGDIQVEATASTRVGVQRYTFPVTKDANVFINVGQGANSENITASDVRTVDDRTVVGEVHVKSNRSTAQHALEFSTWFATRFDRPFTSYGTWDATGATPGSSAAHSATRGLLGAYVTFDATDSQTVQASTGLSYTGAEGAMKNLDSEGLDHGSAGSDSLANPIPFDTIKKQTQKKWNKQLGNVAATGGTQAQRSTFYTSLYHAYLEPATGSDADGTYRGFDDKLHVADGWTYYQYFSLWDTFRSQNQFLAMFQPTRAHDIGKSILAIQREGGWLPRWGFANFETNVMGGDPVSSFLADLWRFGVLDAHDAKVALLDNLDSTPPATSQFQGRAGNPSYIANGFILPAKGTTDTSNSGSATMEYAAADCAVAPLFDSIGDEADAQRFRDRSGNWKNVWDPTLVDSEFGMTGFPRVRSADGGWGAAGAQSSKVGFQEGTPWRYQWLTWQDFPGLTKAVGGEEAVTKRLDTFFSIDKVLADPEQAALHSWVSATEGYTNSFRYDPNNEPDLHAPWLYNFAGEPAKASAVVRAQQTLFTSGPGGITGNDDMGEMSAWYAFSAMGLYPSVSGSGDLLLSTPLFPKIDVRIPDGTHLKHLTITADGADGANLELIDGLSLNGNSRDKSYVNWDSLSVHGKATLDYSLTGSPSTTWGTARGSRPVSPCTSVPTITGADNLTTKVGTQFQEVLATVTASEAALVGATVVVDWGDGGDQAVSLSGAGFTRTVTASHTFATAGTHQVVVSLLAQDGSTVSTTQVPIVVGRVF